jgi:exodeoxyribonuclease VII large subunit
VPDAAEETARISTARARIDRHISARLEHGHNWLEQLRSRPVLADPGAWLPRQLSEVAAARQRADAAMLRRLHGEQSSLAHHRAHARALSPMATLERGYAVVSGADGVFLRDSSSATAGQSLAIRLARGSLIATVDQALPDAFPDPGGTQ